MAETKMNKPEGSRYNKAFGEWLRSVGFDDIDKADRSRLFDILANRSAVSLQLAVGRLAAMASVPQNKTRDRRSSAGQVARAKAHFGALKQANEKIAQQQAYIGELAAAREATPQSEPIDAQVARVLDLIAKVDRKLRKRNPLQNLSLSRGGQLHLGTGSGGVVNVVNAAPTDLLALAQEAVPQQKPRGEPWPGPGRLSL
jgi:hypothetical protein